MFVLPLSFVITESLSPTQMKKKKRREELIALQILECLIFRHHHHRRPVIHHFLPLLSAFCGCLLLLFAAFSFLSPPTTNHHLALNTSMRNENIVMSKLWTSRRSNFYYGCSAARDNFTTAEMNTETDRYLLIRTSGGLNQQRTGITDAVVAAYILNATLVVPKLDQESFWKDASNFSDIFDVDWFSSYLSKDVKIVKQPPEKARKVVTTHVPRKCDPKCYQALILPIFEQKHVQVVELTKFDYRLSDWLDEDLQKLRCRVNYHALRYEPDMLAFSGCYYGGGGKEIRELGKLRKRWKNLHKKDPERERRHGKCPLSPEEVGLMLRALGFGKEVHVYVASGQVYGGEEALAPLKALFPNFHTKKTLASREELAEFSSYSSRMAALDFIVSDESDVFVTNNNGNMAKILAGRRRYFGHKPTIRPNAKKLCDLFLNRANMNWKEFASRVQAFQVGFMGEPNELKHGWGAQFHEYPLSCICKNSEADSTFTLSRKNHVDHKSRGRYNGEVLLEDDQDLSEKEEADVGDQ